MNNVLIVTWHLLYIQSGSFKTELMLQIRKTPRLRNMQMEQPDIDLRLEAQWANDIGTLDDRDFINVTQQRTSSENPN